MTEVANLYLTLPKLVGGIIPLVDESGFQCFSIGLAVLKLVLKFMYIYKFFLEDPLKYFSPLPLVSFRSDTF